MNASEIPQFFPALPDDAFGAVPMQTNPNGSFESALLGAFEDAGAALTRAGASERAFALHRSGLQEMVLDRAQADVALSIASATASRVVQTLTTILGMQV
jgi:flagellar hook-basal body complex protein FliE